MILLTNSQSPQTFPENTFWQYHEDYFRPRCDYYENSSKLRILCDLLKIQLKKIYPQWKISQAILALPVFNCPLNRHNSNIVLRDYYQMTYTPSPLSYILCLKLLLLINFSYFYVIKEVERKHCWMLSQGVPKVLSEGKFYLMDSQ